MDQHNKDESKEIPSVPIETYRWEDVRRSRSRGGYPWTHLYKEPFDEIIGDYQFRIPTMSKSISTPIIRKPINTVEIQDVTEEFFQSEKSGEPTRYVVIPTDLPSDLDNHSKTEGIVEEQSSDNQEILNLESAESSDNISQYLDKEDPQEDPIVAEVPGQLAEPERERAKSEEPKRKRKLSLESSYSRKSLSKLGFLKKLKDAGAKLKVPKFLSGSSKSVEVKDEDNKSPPKPAQPPKEKTKHLVPKHVKPVYIHIPLKPPEGETDEFSYLEFGDKKPEKVEEKPQNIEEGPSNSERRFSDNSIVAIEILKSESIDLDEAAGNGIDVGNSKGDIYIISKDAQTPDENDDVFIFMPGSESPADSNTAGAVLSLSRQNSKKIRSKSSESDKKKSDGKQSKSRSVSRNSSSSSSRKIRSRSAEPQRKRKLSADSSYSRISLSKLGLMKKLRDAKDKIKSSLSNKPPNKSTEASLDVEKKQIEEEPPVEKESKLRAPTSAKNEAKYIHIPLKPPTGETDEFSYLEFEEKKEEPPSLSKLEKTQEEQSSIESPASVQNEGVQFIFLTPPSDDEILEQSPEIPETPSSEGKSFEIGTLKDIAKDAVVETCKTKKKPEALVEEINTENVEESTKIEELQEVKIEEEIHEEAKQEETKPETEELAKVEVAPEKERIIKTEEKIIIDEEDGLKSSVNEPLGENKPEEVEPPQELKSSLKTDSPVLKKKVSFKRRSRDETKDKEYEEIQAPLSKIDSNEKDILIEEKKKLETVGTSQSMSVDEEKCYLDEKIVKTTSLEEDYNKWSKLSDHEYEPVDPPSVNTSPPLEELPPVKDTRQERPAESAANIAGSRSSLELRMLAEQNEKIEEPTAQQFQTDVENRFFSRFKSKPSEPKKEQTVKIEIKADTSESSEPPKQEGPGKFQQAMRAQAGKIKSQFDRFNKPRTEIIKKTSTTTKTKVKKPKFNMPKLPDTFSLSRIKKKTVKERQLSTESNASDDTKKNLFNFKTYPRIFKKKHEQPQQLPDNGSEQQFSDAATFPRTKRKKAEDDRQTGEDNIRIKLHPSSSPEEVPRREYLNPQESILGNGNSNSSQSPSHAMDDMDLDLDEAYQKENQEIHKSSRFSSENLNKRWSHGTFHNEMDFQGNHFRNVQVTDLDSPDESNPKEMQSSQSSVEAPRQGVLEEVDPDIFFLRQKGISQDNIEIGMYLSSEIREAFKSPGNALADIGTYRASNQSLNDAPKKKPVRKPKRKKTPHVSQEKLQDDQDSEQENALLAPPPRPRRRSKKKKRDREPEEHVIPYQETISMDDDWQGNMEVFSNGYQQHEEENVDRDVKEDLDAYVRHILEKYADDEDASVPAPPPRRHRSMKSLTSEQSAPIEDLPRDRGNEPSRGNIVPDTPEETINVATAQSSLNGSQILQELSENGEAPVRPTRTRSRSRGESLASEPTEPCVEEPCVQDFRDYMGYSVVDKNVKREPPLPPPRTPPRRKKSLPTEQRFFTVPRQTEEQPVRPVRNYSTLGPSRPPRRKPPPNMTDEEKEHIDITQYIEIEDEPKCDLQSGEVIQKMKDRPLPAPPRPPRKTKSPEEAAAAGDLEENEEEGSSGEHDRQHEEVHVERRLLLPTRYSYEEETITTGSLVVQPLDGARLLPDSDISHREPPKERVVPIVTDLDDEDSVIPDDFASLRDPPLQTASSKTDVQPEVLKAQKLQVTDLDVDRLSVNELLANKIVVSEIQSGSIETNEIASRSGTGVRINQIELPPNLIQQLLERFQFVTIPQEQTSENAASEPSTRREDNDDGGQKKTPIDFDIDDAPPQRPPRRNEEDLPKSQSTPPQRASDVDIDEEPPPRPSQLPADYIPSQPPASFYALRAQHYVGDLDRDIPPSFSTRRRHKKRTVSTSSDSDGESPQRHLSRRRHKKSPEPSIPQLTGQLIGACVSAGDNALKRLITYITNNVLRNADGQQDVHVMLAILLTLIAGLILLGFGDGKTTHYHHWEYFNPPRDL